jgi:hypothetical protein
MTDMPTYDFIADTQEERTSTHSGQTTGWELIVFELMDDDG